MSLLNHCLQSGLEQKKIQIDRHKRTKSGPDHHVSAPCLPEVPALITGHRCPGGGDKRPKQGVAVTGWVPVENELDWTRLPPTSTPLGEHAFLLESYLLSVSLITSFANIAVL